MKENKRLRRDIFSMFSNEHSHSSAKIGTNKVMSVGMLTGRPEEEMPGSSGDLLKSIRNCTNKFGRSCGVSPRPCGHPPPYQEVWGSLLNFSRDRGGVSDYGRYLPVEKGRERLGPW